MSKTIVMVLGIVLVAVGLLGFVMNPLLGLFEVDTMHNIVHIVTGVLALAAVGMGENASRTFAKVFGVLYLLLGIWGFVAADGMILGMMMNTADHVLHLVLGVVFLWLGFAMKSDMATPATPPATPAM